MKAIKRILSGMLALVMVLVLCPVIPFAEETTTTVEAVDVGTKDAAAQQAGLAGRDEAGANVLYLSDLFATSNMVENRNTNVTLDVNYNGDLYAFNAAGARRQIAAKADANGNRTLENGITYHKSEIALGYMGIKYAKGLGVVPNPEGAEDNYIVYSTAGLNVDRFYAVVGGTGAAATDPNLETAYITFEVWGGTTTDNFVKLAYVDNIRSHLVAEFNVDITGYNYIKLVQKMSEKSNHLKDGKNSNTGCQVAWGDACFYTSSGAPRVDLFEGIGKDAQVAGLNGIPATALNTTYLSDLMGDAKYYVEHLGTNVANANYNNDLYAFNGLGGRKRIATNAVDGYRTIENGVTYHISDIALGYMGTKYEKGIGVHPDAYNKADRYMTFDVSALNVNRFYAVVGATGNTLTEGSNTSIKVTFEVWGGKYNSPSSFVKLAYADSIRSYVIAEFDVDITGYDYIKLVVKMTGTASNSSCAVAWGNAAVYGVAESETISTLGKGPQQAGLPGRPEGSTNIQYLSDLYSTANMVESVNSKVVADKNYNNDLYAFNGLGGRKRIGTNAVDGYRTIENGLTYHISEIALGYLGTKYEKGLGVHPNGVGAADRYIVYNVSGLNVDHFYAVVGGTGASVTDPSIKNQKVTFELWGSQAAENDAATFVKLASVSGIREYLVAEFNVDITGYNFIKLVVKMDADSASNSSCAVAWGDACVYTAPAHKHTPVETRENEKPATCTSVGSYIKVVTCSECGEELSRTPTSVHAVDHTIVTDEAVAPGCETTGLTEGAHCDVCGAVTNKQDVIPATGHTWDEGKITTAPGCEAEGVKTYTCHCGETKTEAVSATGHTPVVDEAVAPDCENDGKTEGSHCDVCGVVIKAQETVPATGHTWDEGKITTAPGCETEGVKTYTCHCGETKTEAVSATGHTPVVDEAVAPDCENDGKTEGSHCDVCGTVIKAQETVPATGHTPVVDAYKAPTCTETGLTEGRHCDVCGKVLVEQNVIEKLVPVAQIDNKLYASLHDAVAEADGKTIVILKDIELTETVEIIGITMKLDMAGHVITADWESDGVVEVLYIHDGANVTITGNGTMISGDKAETNSVVSVLINSTLTIKNGTFISMSCGDVIYTRTNSVVNIYGGTFEAKEDYYGVYYVLDVLESEAADVRGVFNVYGGTFVNFDPANHRCDGDYSNKLAAGYHSIGVNGVYTVGEHVYAPVVTDPTCVDKGYTTHSCVCGDSYVTDYVDALGHTPKAPVIENNVDATCGADGSYDEVVYCDVCGTEISRNTVTVPETGAHDYDEEITKEATPFETGVKTLTCACGDTKEEVIEKAAYTSTLPSTTYQIGLIEPWFMKINCMPCEPGTTTRYDVNDLQTYGAFAIREGLLDEGVNGETLTVEQLINQTNVMHFSKEAGNIVPGTDGRLAFKYDDTLYTYRLHEKIYFVVYAQTSEGWVITEIRNRDLKDQMERNVNAGTFPVLEVDVFNSMLELYDKVSAFRAQYDNPGEGVPQNTATLATTNITFGPAATDGKYRIANSMAFYLIEPWGVKFLGRAAIGSNTSLTEDYSKFTDYGVLVYQDKAGALNGAPSSVLDITDTENVYVFSKSQGTMGVDAYDTTKMTATFNKDIFTYQMDTNVYFMYFVKDGDNFYYSRVFEINIMDEAAKNAANESLKEHERNVYPAMTGLYDAITAYREDYFNRHPEERPQ